MVTRITPSQWNSMVRQAQQKQRQAVDKYNREVRAHNQNVNQAINRRAMEGGTPRRGARDSRPLDGRRKVIE